MELEIINKLFLELSQVATAHTSKELLYREALHKIQATFLMAPCAGAMKMKDIAREYLKRGELR